MKIKVRYPKRESTGSRTMTVACCEGLYKIQLMQQTSNSFVMRYEKALDKTYNCNPFYGLEILSNHLKTYRNARKSFLKYLKNTKILY